MRHHVLVLALLAVFLALPALGAPDAGVVAADAGVKAAVDAGVTVTEVVEAGKAVVEMAKEGTPTGVPSLVWWGLMVAVAGKFLLTLLRKFGYLLGKQTMRLAWLAIAAVVGVATSLGAGMPWYEAAYLGVSAGPGAMIAHELLKLINPAKWAKDKAMAKAAAG